MLSIEGNLPDVIFPSWCNVFVGNSLVLQGKLACARFHFQFNVVQNLVVLVLEGEPSHVIFPSPCNVVRNDLVLVLEGKLAHHSRFSVVVGDVLVLVLEGKLACCRFPSMFNVVGNYGFACFRRETNKH